MNETPCWAREPSEHVDAIQARERILARFSPTVMSGVYQPNPQIRGPHGEAEIWIKDGAIPVGRRSFRLGGERLEAHTKLIADCVDQGKIELAVSSWNLPSFPVQKANGKFRLVQDFRALNEQCHKDAHPLRRIVDIL